MKKKNIRYQITVLVMALLLCGCGNLSGSQKEIQLPDDGRTESGAGEEICFTDDLGRQVNLKPPKKAAALIGSFSDIWLLAGGELAAAQS